MTIINVKVLFVQTTNFCPKYEYINPNEQSNNKKTDKKTANARMKNYCVLIGYEALILEQ